MSPTIMELRAKQVRITDESRARLKELDGADDRRAREIEVEHNAAMAEFDTISDQIRETQEAEEEAERHARRPVPGDTVGRAVDDGYGPDGQPVEAYALRSDQSMAAYARRFSNSGEYRGLTEGGYLRAMVIGPQSDVERRALAGGTDSAGGYTVPTILAANLIDRLRAKSVVFRAGAQTVPLTSDHNVVARVASDPAPAWRLENAAIAESDPTFDAITLVPRSLAVMFKVSRELIQDSLNLGTALPEIMAAAMATELDRVALLGSGTAPEPRGIANFSGLTASGFAGGAISHSALIKARTALRTADTDMMSVVMHPRDEGALAELLDSTGQPLRTPPALANVQTLTTTAIPTDGGAGSDESTVIAGDFSKLMVGIRSELRIEISREVFAANHQYLFVAHLRADIAAERDAHFTTLAGVTG